METLQIEKSYQKDLEKFVDILIKSEIKELNDFLPNSMFMKFFGKKSDSKNDQEFVDAS